VIKSQALTDFIAEWTNLGLRGIDDLPNHSVMYFDRSYTLKGAGAGVVLISPDGDILKYAIQIEFPATNNTTEYKGLVTGLWLAKELDIQIFSSEETLSSWQNKYKKSTTVTMIRWPNIWQKCEGWRSFLMALRYDMSHAWTTGMQII
jgi:hypothetical protein